jgi:hypothetical protein
MQRGQTTNLRQDIINLGQLIESFKSSGNKKDRNALNDKITKKIAQTKPNLPSLTDRSHSSISLNKDFTELVEDYENFLKELEEDEKSHEIFKSFKEKTLDLEEEKKREELETVKEASKISIELLLKQQMINEQLKKDSENIENVIVDTESTIHNSHIMVRNLADASKEENKKRGMYLTAAGTLVGGILGKGLGGIVGLFVAGGTSKWVGKKHDKKLDKVVNM